jgi:hypothetical protein
VAERLNTCTWSRWLTTSRRRNAEAGGGVSRCTDVLCPEVGTIPVHHTPAFLKATRKPSLHRHMDLARLDRYLDDRGFEGKSTRGTAPRHFTSLCVLDSLLCWTRHRWPLASVSAFRQQGGCVASTRIEAVRCNEAPGEDRIKRRLW